MSWRNKIRNSDLIQIFINLLDLILKRGIKMEIFSDITSIKTCFLSNFPPKECGIATFTRDLSDAMDKKFNPKLKSKVIALNATEEFYNYNKKVILQINKEDINHYIEIARKINERDDIKIVSIQHEFGIFGGDYGCYLIPFLETLEKPVVVTFHSVLPNPDEMRKKVVRAIASRATSVIVMANSGIDILNKDYGIPKNKIYVIPHGIPSVEYLEDNSEIKKRLKLSNKIVLSTFGLLSRGKGIEYVIKSLPPLIKKYPNLLYLVIGETHPVVRRNEGEKYRNELVELVEKLGLRSHVKFYNKYLTLQEIIDYLFATDIYICTNLEKNQITSGTLAYALGCGKPIISTPSIYAEEILANNRGVLAKFKNPESYTQAINQILSDSEFRKTLEKRAYTYSRPMTWPNVAFSYLRIFNKIVKLREEVTEKFPKIKLNHLLNMTDNFGVIQFANLSTPDKNSGYTLDDNSRALIFSVLHHKLFNSSISLGLSKTYLKFLENAQKEDGKFKNHHKNKEEMLEDDSEDAFGRAIWALSYTVNKSAHSGLVEKSKDILEKSLVNVPKLNSPRAKAFALCGLTHHYKQYPSEEILLLIKQFADSLIELYEKESSENWQWFEPYLTYSNAKLPESLFLTYEIIKDKKYLIAAEKTLDFLSNVVFIKGELSPIGQNGWYNRNGERAFFDQQPLDVSCMVQAYLSAYKIIGNKDYYDKAILAFNWFLGKNHLKQMIYNETTGGCHDGLGKHAINLNQGAESTISYLIARIFLEEFKMKKNF